MNQTDAYNTQHSELLHDLIKAIKNGQPEHPYIYFKQVNGNIEVSPYGSATSIITGNSGVLSELADITNTNEAGSYKATLWYKTWKEATLGDLIVFTYNSLTFSPGTNATVTVGRTTSPNASPTNIDGKVVISVSLNNDAYTFTVNNVSFTTALKEGVNVIAVHTSTGSAFVNGVSVTTQSASTTTTLADADLATPVTETSLTTTTYNALGVSLRSSITSLVIMPYLGNDELLQDTIQAYSTTESSMGTGTFYSNIYEASQISTSPPIVGIATDPPLLSGDPRINVFIRGSSEAPSYEDLYKGTAHGTDEPMMKDGKYYMLISQDRATSFQPQYDNYDLWPFASEWTPIENLTTIPETWNYFQVKVVMNLKAKAAEYAENTVSKKLIVSTGNGNEKYYTNDPNLNETGLEPYIKPLSTDGVLEGTYQRHFPKNHVFGYEGKLVHFSGDGRALNIYVPYWDGAWWLIPKQISDTKLPLISSNVDPATKIAEFTSKELNLPNDSFNDDAQMAAVYSGGYGVVVRSVHQGLDPDHQSIIKVILPDGVNPPEVNHTGGLNPPGWSKASAPFATPGYSFPVSTSNYTQVMPYNVPAGVWLIKQITLNTAPTNAQMNVSCDDGSAMWINGQQVYNQLSTGMGMRIWNWSGNVTSFLKSGTNRIAVLSQNRWKSGSGPGGFTAQLIVDGQHIITDGGFYDKGSFNADTSTWWYLQILHPNNINEPGVGWNSPSFGESRPTNGILQPGWSVQTKFHETGNPYVEGDMSDTGYYYNALYLKGPYMDDAQIYLSEISQDGHMTIRVRANNQVIYEGTATNAFYQGYNAEQIHATNLHYERSSLCHYEDNKKITYITPTVKIPTSSAEGKWLAAYYRYIGPSAKNLAAYRLYNDGYAVLDKAANANQTYPYMDLVIGFKRNIGEAVHPFVFSGSAVRRPYDPVAYQPTAPFMDDMGLLAPLDDYHKNITRYLMRSPSGLPFGFAATYRLGEDSTVIGFPQIGVQYQNGSVFVAEYDTTTSQFINWFWMTPEPTKPALKPVDYTDCQGVSDEAMSTDDPFPEFTTRLQAIPDTHIVAIFVTRNMNTSSGNWLRFASSYLNNKSFGTDGGVAVIKPATKTLLKMVSFTRTKASDPTTVQPLYESSEVKKMNVFSGAVWYDETVSENSEYIYIHGGNYPEYMYWRKTGPTVLNMDKIMSDPSLGSYITSYFKINGKLVGIASGQGPVAPKIPGGGMYPIKINPEEVNDVVMTSVYAKNKTIYVTNTRDKLFATPEGEVWHKDGAAALTIDPISAYIIDPTIKESITNSGNYKISIAPKAFMQLVSYHLGHPFSTVNYYYPIDDYILFDCEDDHGGSDYAQYENANKFYNDTVPGPTSLTEFSDPNDELKKWSLAMAPRMSDLNLNRFANIPSLPDDINTPTGNGYSWGRWGEAIAVLPSPTKMIRVGISTNWNSIHDRKWEKPVSGGYQTITDIYTGLDVSGGTSSWGNPFFSYWVSVDDYTNFQNVGDLGICSSIKYSPSFFYTTLTDFNLAASSFYGTHTIANLYLDKGYFQWVDFSHTLNIKSTYEGSVPYSVDRLSGYHNDIAWSLIHYNLNTNLYYPAKGIAPSFSNQLYIGVEDPSGNLYVSTEYDYRKPLPTGESPISLTQKFYIMPKADGTFTPGEYKIYGITENFVYDPLLAYKRMMDFARHSFVLNDGTNITDTSTLSILAEALGFDPITYEPLSDVAKAYVNQYTNGTIPVYAEVVGADFTQDNPLTVTETDKVNLDLTGSANTGWPNMQAKVSSADAKYYKTAQLICKINVDISGNYTIVQ